MRDEDEVHQLHHHHHVAACVQLGQLEAGHHRQQRDAGALAGDIAELRIDRDEGADGQHEAHPARHGAPLPQRRQQTPQADGQHQQDFPQRQPLHMRRQHDGQHRQQAQQHGAGQEVGHAPWRPSSAWYAPNIASPKQAKTMVSTVGACAGALRRVCTAMAVAAATG